jgi:Ca-activated chloride channel family protein
MSTPRTGLQAWTARRQTGNRTGFPLSKFLAWRWHGTPGKCRRAVFPTVNGLRKHDTRSRPIAIVIACAVTIWAVAATAQTPRVPSFESGVEIVNLQVSVTDGQSFVTGLSKSDFAVYEDGVRQDLSLFIHEALPISMVLLIDTSASMRGKLGEAQKAATRFVDTLGPADEARVVQFNERVTTLEDFTNDHKALDAAIARTEASGSTALYNALYIALKDLSRQKQSGGEMRRRAIVLLSDGEDVASLVTDEQVLELARQTEVGVYAIGLRGGRDIDRARGNFSQATYLLKTLARESGGRAYFPESLSELNNVYGRIAEELRTLYSLGYLSDNHMRDGKWRRIVVRVPDHTSYEIRHKIGYYAPKG